MNNLIHKYVEVWNTQQVERLSNIFSQIATYKDFLQEGNAINVLSTSIKETAQAFPDVSFEILTLIKGSTDNLLVLEWLMGGTNKGPFFGTEPTHKKVQIFGVDIIQVKDERISAIRSFYDSNQFTTQLGM